MNNPLISIIIPIYNGEKYIDKCLSRVVAQTYKNIEILCVINGTTDTSEEKVREWMQKDERIRILVTDIADLGHASNLGIENTTGPYLSFVDVDDWVEPEYIEKLYGGIKKGYKICKGNCTMVLKTCQHTKEEVQERYLSVERPSCSHVDTVQFMIDHYLRN